MADTRYASNPHRGLDSDLMIVLRWNLTMLLISLMDVDEIALSPIGLLA